MYRGKGRGSSSNFRGRGGGRSNYSKQSTQPKGVFADGIWHCNCTPRLPAEHFKVKKEGKNQGRWFYTCQEKEPKRCDFFLWDEDAKVREEGAVLAGKRSEPGAQDGWNAGRERGGDGNDMPAGKGLFARNERQEGRREEDDSTASPTPPPSYRTAQAVGNSTKRSAFDAELDEHEFGSWDMSGEDERALGRVADAAAPMTPNKAQKTGVYATPATTANRKLPWLEQSAEAPAIKQEDDYFTTPSKQPSHSSAALPSFADPQTPAAAPTPAAAATPTPSTRHKDALHDPADDASSLTAEILASLTGVKIPPDTMSNLRSILTRHDLKTQGIKKGRDISRLALKAKDAKIAELQARIASLEADREVERGLQRIKKWDSGEGGNWTG